MKSGVSTTQFLLQISQAFTETTMQESQPKPSRRGFFFGAAATGAAAATIVALPGTSALIPEQQVLKPAPEKGGGYSLSEHVKHYYRTTRI
jgi:hypothetical protein